MIRTTGLVLAISALGLVPCGAGAQLTGDHIGPQRTEFAKALESMSHVESAPVAASGIIWGDAPHPVVVASPQVSGRSGRTYMIAGAAALVGGLLVGGDVGRVIAAGGVLLGVYGIILYY